MFVRPGLLGALLVALSSTACLAPLSFGCDDDDACMLDDVAGICVAPGHCAYPEPTCESGLRFGPAAGAGMASDCVDDATFDSDGACGPCEATPVECRSLETTCERGQCVQTPLAAGTPCRADEPCVMAASCDGDGTCVVHDAITCDEPPSPCHVSVGVCSEGFCAYKRRDAGDACEDGNGCTAGDRCDAFGICVSGPECASDNPCAVGVCGGAQCSYFPAVDGTNCGLLLPGHVCCAGACIDATSDPEHCGACGQMCGSDELCVAVGASGACMPASVL